MNKKITLLPLHILTFFQIGLLCTICSFLSAQDLKYVHPEPIGDYLSSVAIIPNTQKIIALADATHTVLMSDDLGENIRYEFPLHDDKFSSFNDIKFVDENLGFLLKNSGIFRTKDGGQTWNKLKDGPWQKIEVNVNGFVVAIDAFKLTYSSDFGDSWSRNRDFDIDEFIEDVSLLDDGKVFVAGTDGIYMSSSNGGQSWDALRFTAEPRLNVIHFANEQVGFIVGSSRFTVFTIDGGASWFNSDYPGFFTITELTMDDQGTLWGTNGDELFSSQDTGAIWQEVIDFESNFRDPQGDKFNFSLQDISVDQNNIALCGSSGTLLVSADRGASWKLVNEVVSDDAIWDIRQYGQEVMTAGQDGTIMFSPDAGQTWDSHKFPVFEFQFVERFENGTWIVGGHNGAVFTTTDFGMNWSENKGPVGGDDLRRAKILPDQSVIIAGEDGTLRKSVDMGAFWQDLDSPFVDENANFIGHIDFLTEDFGIVVGSRDQVYVTEDGGESWSDISINSDDPKILRFVQIIDSDFYIIASNSYIYKTIDGGISYEITKTDDLSGVYISEDGKGVGLNREKLYITEDFGDTWTLKTNKIEPSLNQGFVTSENLWLVGFRGLIWNDPNAFEPLSTSTQNALIDNDVFTIYPNPSNGQLQIKFDEALSGKMTVDIYNQLGQKVYGLRVKNIATVNAIEVNADLDIGIYIVTIRDETNRILGRDQVIIAR